MLKATLSWHTSSVSQPLRTTLIGLALVFAVVPSWSVTDGDVISTTMAKNAHWPGIVVEEVDEQSAPGKAGLETGDIVLAWERPTRASPDEAERSRPGLPSEGHIESAFDWLWMEVEQAPRGPIRLLGERDGKPIVFDVGVGRWDVRVRPRMSPTLVEDFLEGKELIEKRDLESGIALWQESVGRARELGDASSQCWLQLRIGEIWSKAKAWRKSQAAYRAALEVAHEPFAQVVIWDAIGKNYMQQNDFTKAEESYWAALEIRQAIWGESLGAAFNLNNLGKAAWNLGNLKRAAEHNRQALSIQEKLAPGSLHVGRSLNSLGIVAWKRGRYLQATEHYQRALKIQESLNPGSLHMAYTLNNLGLVAWQRGKLEQAEGYYQQAIEIQERLAPRSVFGAGILHNLGLIAWDRRDLERTVEHYQRALEIYEELGAKNTLMAASLTGLGEVAWHLGDLQQAEEHTQRALRIQEDLAPDSLEVAGSLQILGNVAENRGDLERAEEYYRQALEIQENRAPESLDAAGSLNNLGSVVWHRGDPERAEEYYQQALEIRENLAPGNRNSAASLDNLGLVAWHRGNLERAEEYHQRALKIRESLAPESLDVAVSLSNLGNIAWHLGDLERATEYAQRSLKIKESLAPESLSVAKGLRILGNMARSRGDLEQAMEQARRALRIQEKLAPGSLDLAQTLNELGKIAWQRGELEQAATSLQRSIAAFEAQVGKLGGSHELRGRFRTEHNTIYRDAIEIHLELDLPEKSFEVLERSRARSFLALLSEKHLDFSADIPNNLVQTRRRLATLHDRTLHRMMDLNPTRDKDKTEALMKELQDLRREYEDNIEAIRRASPKLARLQAPQPLNLESVRQSLDPGTVLLSYSVGENRSDLFAVTRQGELEVYPLPAQESLKSDIELLRNLIQDRSLRPHRMARLADLSHQLYKTLIEPAEPMIESSERVLIIPDGPLHLLPFGALIHKSGTGPSTPGKFLVEWKPLHFVLSGTVYAELKKLRRSPLDDDERIELAAFGDPHYPQRSAIGTSITDVRLRSAVERNLLDFQPLPNSRWEVEEIARLYPDTARTYLGLEATEERAKSLDQKPRIVHFATHAYSNDNDPLSSAVALTIPEQLTDDRDNGLLQAWEIFERLRLDADLVVLSACETAVGHDQGGDGLLGLSRAFQYAGARSVAASLWKVSDRATAELMLRFYRRLAAGQPKDAALRGAQLSLIRDPIQMTNSRGEPLMKDTSAPYYWAAFQIYGDWQ